MRIGSITAQRGEHAFGYLTVAAGRSALRPDIPVHLFVGAEPGPTLLVHAIVHGPEVIGALCILNVVQKLDPRRLRGQVVLVPVLNRIGFDLRERGSKFDGKDINRLFPGRPNGCWTYI